MKSATSNEPAEIRDLLQSVGADILTIFRVYSRVQHELTPEVFKEIQKELESLEGTLKASFFPETNIMILEETNMTEQLKEMNSVLKEILASSLRQEALLAALAGAESRTNTPELTLTAAPAEEVAEADPERPVEDDVLAGNIDFYTTLTKGKVEDYFQVGRMGCVTFNLGLFYEREFEAKGSRLRRTDVKNDLLAMPFFVKEGVTKWKQTGQMTTVIFMTAGNPMTHGVTFKEERTKSE